MDTQNTLHPSQEQIDEAIGQYLAAKAMIEEANKLKTEAEEILKPLISELEGYKLSRPGIGKFTYIPESETETVDKDTLRLSFASRRVLVQIISDAFKEATKKSMHKSYLRFTPEK